MPGDFLWVNGSCDVLELGLVIEMFKNSSRTRYVQMFVPELFLQLFFKIVLEQIKTNREIQT